MRAVTCLKTQGATQKGIAIDKSPAQMDAMSTKELQRADYKKLWRDVAANLELLLPETESASNFVSRGLNSAAQCGYILFIGKLHVFQNDQNRL